jgi:D-hexose-6-phosphate mutarotase
MPHRMTHQAAPFAPYLSPQPSGDEVLYVRPDAVFDKSKPISGGIPLCFPQASQLGPGDHALTKAIAKREIICV